MQKRTSLKDIAAKVGVSTALVSYVLNGRLEGRINKDVAKKIRETAVKLNYQPNHMARSLKTNRTNTIGLVVADISNPFSSSLARIIEDEAERLGYTVIYGSSDESEIKSAKIISALRNRQVDGLIIFPPGNSESQIRQLKKQGVPFVLVDRYFPSINCDSICINNHEAAFTAVGHLVKEGRKRIGMISYTSTLAHLQDRIDGYREALTDAGIMHGKELVRLVGIDNKPLEITTAVESLINGKKPVDAILFASNRIAYYALNFLQEKNIRIPDDLCLVAFDESEAFDFFHAPLSYIRQPLLEMGRLATQLLLEKIPGDKSPVKVVLPAELVIRKSSTPPCNP